MATLIKKAQKAETTKIQKGMKVSFEGNLPGGYYDNYSGYSKVGSIYGTVTKVNKVTAIVETRDGDVYKTNINELTII